MLEGLIGLGLIGGALALTTRKHASAAQELVEVLEGQTDALAAMIRQGNCREAYIALRIAKDTASQLRVHRESSHGMNGGRMADEALREFRISEDDFGERCVR